MAVESWFPAFLGRLTKAVPRADWEPATSEFWVAFYRSLTRNGVTEDEAAEAMYLLAESPPKWAGELIASFKAQVDSVRALAAATAKGNGEIPSDRAAAESAALNCDDCGGKTGLTYRYRSNPEDSRGPHVVLYCLCKLGRWLKDSHAKGGEEGREVGRRLPDLADHPKLYGKEHRDPPGVTVASVDRWPSWSNAVRGIAVSAALPAPVRPASLPAPLPAPARPRGKLDLTPAQKAAIAQAPDIGVGPDGKTFVVIPPWTPAETPAY